MLIYSRKIGQNKYIFGIFALSKLLFVPSLIDFDVGRNSHNTLSCSVAERTTGSNLYAVFWQIAIAFFVRNAGLATLAFLVLFVVFCFCLVLDLVEDGLG